MRQLSYALAILLLALTAPGQVMPDGSGIPNPFDARFPAGRRASGEGSGQMHGPEVNDESGLPLELPLARGDVDQQVRGFPGAG